MCTAQTHTDLHGHSAEQTHEFYILVKSFDCQQDPLPSFCYLYNSYFSSILSFSLPIIYMFFLTPSPQKLTQAFACCVVGLSGEKGPDPMKKRRGGETFDARSPDRS